MTILEATCEITLILTKKTELYQSKSKFDVKIHMEDTCITRKTSWYWGFLTKKPTCLPFPPRFVKWGKFNK